MQVVLRCQSHHTWTEPGPCPICGSQAVTTDRPEGTAASGTSESGARPAAIPGYAILEEIGSGGMGVVYRATQVSLGRAVALKVIRAGELAQPRDQKRFVQEAEVVAKLRHPNIVQVFDVGVAQGQPYYTMELIAGVPLSKRLAGERIPDREAARLVATLARAVDHAHQHGIVHRDLKPENVLLDADGTPKLVDFGVAKRLAVDDGLTEVGKPIGTPSYMAPEQAAGKKEIGPAADIYSLGVILYKLATGRVPFEGDNLYDILHKIITEEPVSPAWYRTDIPRDLEAICLKCLRKNPAERYATAADLAADLDRYLNHERISVGWTPPWRRAAKWVRRHPTTTTGLLLATVVALASLVFAGWYYDRHIRVRVSYYADFTRRWGDIVGIGPLSEEQVRARPVSYKFSTRGGRLERLDVVDADGQPTQDDRILYMGSLDGAVGGSRERELREASSLDDDATSDRPGGQTTSFLYRKRECTFTFERDASGRITSECARDRDGKVIFKLQYTSATTATFTNAAGYPVTAHSSGAAFVDFTRDEQGYNTEVHFRDRDGKPTNAESGAFGWRFGYTPEGWVERITYLDAAGKPFRDRAGYTGFSRTYNALGLLVEIRYLDAEGNPTYSREGAAGYRVEYDQYGRETERWHIDVDGKTIPGRHGIAGYRRSYASPFETTIEFFDELGQPLPTLRREHALTQRTADGGKTMTVRYLDAAGQPKQAAGLWIGGYTQVFDRFGSVTEETFFDPDGRPTLHQHGFAREVLTYDDDGNLTGQAYFDAAGRATRNRSWVARAEYRYDPAGRRTEEMFFGPDGQPTRCKDWYTRSVSRWDPDGRERSREYFGPDGRPTLHRLGYSRIDYEYGDRGWVTRWRFFDPAGNPAWHKDGFTSLVKEYDDRGTERSRRCFGPDDRRLTSWSGTHEFRYERDATGYVTREAWFGPDGQQRTNTDGYCSVVRTRDRSGRMTREEFRGPVGERVPHVQGYWELRQEFEPDGYVKTRSYHDRDGNPTPRDDGAALIRTEWNPPRTVKSDHFFDKNQKPLAAPDNIAVTTVTYGDRDQVVRREYRDAAGQLVPGPAGYPAATLEYDDRGELRRILYLGPDDKPWRNEAGRYGLAKTRDDRRLVVAESYLDASGNPLPVEAAPGELGWTTAVATYDDRGLVTRWRWLDSEGRPTRNRSGFARSEQTYDARGNRTSAAYFAPDDSPALHKEGNAKVVWEYTDGDVEKDGAFYDLDGRLKVIPKYGYARRLREVDRWGNIIRLEYRGADDKPMIGPEGFAWAELDPDNNQRNKDMRWFDVAGQRIATCIVITRIEPGTQAAAIGLRPEDVITHYNGQPTPHTEVFLTLRGKELPTDPPRELRIERDGQPLSFQIRPGRLGVRFETRRVQPAKK